MTYTRDTWPIAAAMLQFPAVRADGTRIQDSAPEVWADDLRAIRDAGFDRVEINDNWLRIGDLDASRIGDLGVAADEAGLVPSSVCVVRSSIIDPVTGAANLDYTHRTLEAAAALGSEVVSIGFHRPLLPEQRRQLWFWTVPGEVDAPGDDENFALAVSRVRELGAHAADLGLELTLEMYEDTYLGDGPIARRFVDEVDLSNVGLNPDVGNLVRLHRPIDDWLETLALTLPRANYWHVKNYQRDEDVLRDSYVAVPAPLELGIINYRHAVRDAIALGFDGHFVCEHYGGDGLGVSAINRDYLRRILPASRPDAKTPTTPTREAARA